MPITNSTVRIAQLVLFMFIISTVGCDSKPGPVVVRAWQDIHRHAILDEYSNFEGYLNDADVGVAIFSYRIKSQQTNTIVFEKIIEKLKSYGYVLISSEQNELVMRRPVSYSKHNGFDEYRFMASANLQLIVVMFANLDSAAELDMHNEFILKYHRIARDINDVP